MNNKLSKMDREMIKLQYGSVRNYNKLKQEEKKNNQLEQERQWKVDESIALAQIKERKANDLILIENRKTFIQEAEKFKTYIANKYNNYLNFLIAYDICNCDYCSIESDLKKGKYNISLVKELYNIACQMCSKLQFNIECLNYKNIV